MHTRATLGNDLLRFVTAVDGSSRLCNLRQKTPGTDLEVATCQGAAPGGKCDASTMMMHFTPGATGYFENVSFLDGGVVEFLY